MAKRKNKTKKKKGIKIKVSEISISFSSIKKAIKNLLSKHGKKGGALLAIVGLIVVGSKFSWNCSKSGCSGSYESKIKKAPLPMKKK